jgi:hypothetical protein
MGRTEYSARTLAAIRTYESQEHTSRHDEVRALPWAGGHGKQWHTVLDNGPDA